MCIFVFLRKTENKEQRDERQKRGERLKATSGALSLVRIMRALARGR